MNTNNGFLYFRGRYRNHRYTPPKTDKPKQAPQAPNMSMRTNAHNQYRGHGRGQ